MTEPTIEINGTSYPVSKEVHKYVTRLLHKLDDLIVYTENDHRPVCKNTPPQNWDSPSLEHCTCWVKREMAELLLLKGAN